MTSHANIPPAPLRAPGRLIGPRIGQSAVIRSLDGGSLEGLLQSQQEQLQGQQKQQPAGGHETTTEAIAALVEARFAGLFSADPGIRYGDSAFYLPTLTEVAFILAASQLERKVWLQERFDCDDFAYVLKGEMSAHAYESADLRYGLCFGIVWGNFDWVEGFHAVNWVVTADESIWLVEPQTDDIYPLTRCTGGINLLLV